MYAVKLEYRSDEGPQSFGHAARAQLATARCVHLVGGGGTGDLRRFYDDLLEAIGEAANLSEDSATGAGAHSRWTDVRFDPALQHTFRHSCTAQPLHTDGAYDDQPADAVIMYCERQAARGGETTFVAAEDLIAALGAAEPDLLDELQTRPVRFAKTDRSRMRPIVSFDRRGPVLTWNYFRVAPGQDPLVQRLVERFHRFLEERVVGSSLVAAVRLSPGDAVVWRDDRVLHGRTAFSATQPGERILWKAPIAATPVDSRS